MDSSSKRITRRGLILTFIACVVIVVVYRKFSITFQDNLHATIDVDISEKTPANHFPQSSVKPENSSPPDSAKTPVESPTVLSQAGQATETVGTPKVQSKIAATTPETYGTPIAVTTTETVITPKTTANDKFSFTTDTKPTEITPSTSVEPVHGRGWDSGTFCDDLLHNTFSQLVPVCATDHNEQSAIVCKRTPKSTPMIECSMRNVLIRPKKLLNRMGHVVNSEGVELLENDLVSCKSPNMDGLHRTTESNDHTTQMIEESVRHPPSSNRSDCQRWISEPTFLFLGVNVHVYFEVITWYNVYKSILDQGNIGSYKVFRIASGNFQYLFSDYEKLLFPGIEFVQDLKEESICFEKLILPPRGFSSLLFRCKMEYSIRGQCFRCDGKGRPGTAIRSFRTQALKACSLNDSVPIAGYRNPKRIVIILRKQYIRHPSDKPGNFNRVLANSDQLIAELKKRFNVDVATFHGEDLPMCEQIRMVHDADIFIGVHGAGLVHAWWLQDNALLFEIVPTDQVSNPTFNMLTTLAGINYKSFRIPQRSLPQVSVDIKKFTDTLDTTIQNGI